MTTDRLIAHTPDGDFGETLMADVPRGVPTRRLSEQTAPQARFIDPNEIAGHPSLQFNPSQSTGQLVLGAIGDQLIGIEDDRHMLTVAGSRAGKSVTLTNNLLCYSGSVLCTDPKGELANNTAQARADQGQAVKILDPFGITDEALAPFRVQYNPMSLLTLTNRFIIEDSLQLTDGLILQSGQEKDPHWNESASHFIAGLILYTAVAPALDERERHLITVRQLLNRALETSDDGKTFVIEEAVLSNCAHLRTTGFKDIAAMIEGAVRGFYDKGTEERGSVLSTARRHTQFLEFSAMKSVLTGHDVDLSDLKTDPGGTTIYLVLPATRMSLCNRWLRILINQLIDSMERTPGTPRVPVLVALDEFPVLGFMRQLQDATGQIASFGVKLWVIIQDWGQGKALYKERFESFAANAGILQAFGNVDVTTTEYLSKRLGDTLIEESRFNETNRKQKDQGLKGEQMSYHRYPLMTADEIARTFSRADPLKRQLVLWAGVRPMILQRVAYYDPASPMHRVLNGTP